MNQRCTHLSLRSSIPYACHWDATSPLVCHCETPTCRGRSNPKEGDENGFAGCLLNGVNLLAMTGLTIWYYRKTGVPLLEEDRGKGETGEKEGPMPKPEDLSIVR